MAGLPDAVVAASFGPSGVEAFYNEKDEAYFAQARTDIGPLLPVNADRVLEIGCGTGATMRWLRTQRTVRYAVGIEVSPDAAQRARREFDHVAVLNAEASPLPDGPFDLIILLDVLEHLVDPWRMVDRLSAVLNPGGSIIVSIPNVSHYSIIISLLRGQWNYTNQGLLDRTHLRFFTANGAMDLMSRGRLKVDAVARNSTIPLEGFIKSQRLRWYCKKLLPSRFFTLQHLIRSATT